MSWKNEALRDHCIIRSDLVLDLDAPAPGPGLVLDLDPLFQDQV